MDLPGPLALVGSGEYLPVMQEVEAGLLAGRPPVFVQLATAAAPEGERSLGHWHALGLAAAERLGATQVVVPVVDRESADDPANAALVRGAGLIYLSGGNPTYLAATLLGTRVLAAIVDEWKGGAALAGCSAGAIALTDHVPDFLHPMRDPADGFAIVPHLRVLPHFDRFAGRFPDFLLKRVVSAPPGVTVVGIDEDTALVGGPDEWSVQGRQSVWVLTAHGRTEFPAGTTLLTALAG